MGNALGSIAPGIATLVSKKPTKPGDMASKQAGGTLKGYFYTAPQSYALNQAYQPAYLGLGSQNLQDILFGNAGGTENYQYGWGHPNADGTFDQYRTIAVNRPQTVGLLDTLNNAVPRLQDIYQRGAASGVAGNLGLLNANLGAAQDYYNASNPQVAGLRDRLAANANLNLDMGSRIDPSLSRSITNGVRTDWAARGLGQTMPAQLREALQLYAGGEGLRQSRLSQAQSLTGTLAQTAPDFTSFILGLGGNPVKDAMGLVSNQQGLAFQGNTYDPYNAVAGQGALEAERNRMIDQKQRAQAWGDTIGGVADVAGGFMSGGMSGALGAGGK